MNCCSTILLKMTEEESLTLLETATGQLNHFLAFDHCQEVQL